MNAHMTTPPASVEMVPLGDGDGMCITPGNGGTDLTQLESAGLDTLLAGAGHIVMRGFAPGSEGFNRLVEHYSPRVTLDPARVFQGNTAQKVDSGYDAIGLHMENGTTPFAPDLLWFYCEKAAVSGSETTVCDGYRVWEALSERSRELFSAQPITYSRTVPAHLWQKMAAVMANDGRQEEDVTKNDLYELAGDSENVVFVEFPDGSLYYEYSAHAAHPTTWSDRTAWANSLLGPSVNYETPKMCFADGSAIPADVEDEYTRVTAELTEALPWQDGDMVLIDNSRVMHGRRAITDPNRTIYNAQSYARHR